MEPDVEPIAVEEARPVRHEVLRKGRPWDEVVYARDDEADTLHLGAFVNGMLVSVATLLHEAPPNEPREDAWRLRGMATVAAHRGHGLGSVLLGRCLEHAAANGGRLVWCNARIGAVDFYERQGFVRIGEEFDIPGAGRHFVMRKTS